MLPDRVSNPGPLTYESDVLPIALRGPAAYLLVGRDCYFVLADAIDMLIFIRRQCKAKHVITGHNRTIYHQGSMIGVFAFHTKRVEYRDQTAAKTSLCGWAVCLHYCVHSVLCHLHVIVVCKCMG